MVEPMQLTEVYEGRNGTFGDLALRAVRAGPELRELRLACTDLTRHPDDDILAALPGAPPAAYHATLFGAVPSGYSRGESGRRSVRTVADLCEALRCDSELEVADLRSTRLGDSGCRLIAKLLGDPHGPPLLHLDLGGNSLTDVSAVNLAQALRRNGTLVHLGLDDNNIGVAGALELAALVTVSQSLISLSLAHNERIGARGVAALAQALPDSAPLVHLTLQRCGAGRGGSTLALRALEASFEAPLPAFLREVLLGGNGFGPGERRALWAALARGGRILKLGLDNGGGVDDPARSMSAYAELSQGPKGQAGKGSAREDTSGGACSGVFVETRGWVESHAGDTGLSSHNRKSQGSAAGSWAPGGESSESTGASQGKGLQRSATSANRPGRSVEAGTLRKAAAVLKEERNQVVRDERLSGW